MFSPFSELPSHNVDIFGNPKRFGGCGEPPLAGQAASTATKSGLSQPSSHARFGSDEKDMELTSTSDSNVMAVELNSGRLSLGQVAKTKREAYLRYRQELADQVAQQKALARRRMEEEARLDALDDARIEAQRRAMAERERSNQSSLPPQQRRGRRFTGTHDTRAQSTPAIMTSNNLLTSNPTATAASTINAPSLSSLSSSDHIRSMSVATDTIPPPHHHHPSSQSLPPMHSNINNNHLRMNLDSTTSPSTTMMINERQVQSMMKSMESRMTSDITDIVNRMIKEMRDQMENKITEETRSLIRTVAQQSIEIERLRSQMNVERQRNEEWMRQVVKLQQGLTTTAMKQSRKIDDLAEEFFRWKLVVQRLFDASVPNTHRQLPATSATVKNGSSILSARNQSRSSLLSPAVNVSASASTVSVPTQIANSSASLLLPSASTLRNESHSSGNDVYSNSSTVMNSHRRINEDNNKNNNNSSAVAMNAANGNVLKIPPLELGVLSKQKENQPNLANVMNNEHESMDLLGIDGDECRVLQSDSQLVSCSESEMEEEEDHDERRKEEVMSVELSETLMKNGDCKEKESSNDDELVMIMDDDIDDENEEEEEDEDDTQKNSEHDFDDLLSMHMSDQSKDGPIHQQMTPDCEEELVLAIPDPTADDNDTSDFPQFSEHSSDSEVELLCRIQQETARVAKLRLA